MAFVEWLNEFQVNTGDADLAGVSDPQIIGLSNGNILVAWTETGTNGVGTTDGTDVIGKIYNSEGGLVRDSYRINTSRSVDNESDFDLAPTNDGGFILVYVDNDGANSRVTWERKDSTGNNQATRDIASETGDGDFDNPQVVVNNVNNSSFVTFTDLDVGGIFNPDDDDIRAVRLDSAGTIITAEFDAADNNGDDQRENASAINTNGELVTAYRDVDDGSVIVEVRSTSGAFQHRAVVDSNGTPLDPQVTTLRNGNIAVSWTDDGGDVNRAVYNSNLGVVLGKTAIDNVDANESAIVALTDGDFVVIYDDDSASNRLVARRFNSDGSSDGGAVIPFPSAATQPEIGITADGRVLFTWIASGNVLTSIWDPRGTTINTSDFDAPPLNFVDGDLIQGGVGATTINGDSGTADTIIGRAFNDTINGGSDNDTIDGNGGNDTLNGDAGNDTIDGGTGNDTINGGTGVDDISGGAGADTIIVSNGHNIDNVAGGSGTDTLDLSDITSASGAVNINLNTGSWTGLGGTRTLSSIEVIEATQEDDTVTSTFGNQTINLNGGDDTLIHGDGQFIDDIDGGSGIDLLDLSDELTDGVTINENAGTWSGLGGTRSFSSFENVNGTQADDNIFVDTGVSIINGNGGNDTIRAGFSEDTVNGGAGNDTFVVTGNEFIDNTDGGSGTDTLDHSGLASSYSGADVNFDTGIITSTRTSGGTVTVASIETYLDNDEGNTITDRSGAMTIVAGGGNDTVIENTSGGTDNFDLGAGNDTLEIQNDGIFGDVFEGGAGIDTADFSAIAYSSTDLVVIDLQAGTVSDGFGGSEVLSGFENVIGSQGQETIIGTAGDNEIDGRGGIDTIMSGDGEDIVFGRGGSDDISLGLGADFALGGGGNDTIRGGNGGDDVQGGAGADMLFGDAGNDEILGGSGGDTIEGGTGNDTIDGGNAADTIFGGAGNDVITGGGFTDFLRGGANQDTISGGGSADEIYGDDGGDILFGNNGADFISGGTGADTLNGGAANDELRGGGGADFLLGSTGDDRLYGDGGGDTFQFRANHGNDRIFDFQDGVDVIEFDIGSINDISDLSFNNVFAGVDIDYGSGSIRVLGLSESDFSNADFVFI
jgi:Ca2+-binding RTX toxin-like protein